MSAFKILLSFFICLSIIIIIGCDPGSGNDLSNNSNIIEKSSFASSANSGYESMQFSADMSQSGYVSNYYGSYSNVSMTKTGKTSGWYGTEYKSIFSFDTSAIPDDAVILNVVLAFTVDYNDLLSIWNEYFIDYLKVDIADNDGFGGSYSLTSSDFSASYAARTTFAYNPAGFPVLPPDLREYINKDGTTQFRIGFETNPENYLIEFFMTDPDKKPYLHVAWEQPVTHLCDASVLNNNDNTILDTDTGKVTAKAVEKDGVVIGSYYQYLPEIISADELKVVVLVHGSTNNACDTALTLINRWTDAADEKQLLLIAPVFDTENYDQGPWGGYRGMFGRHGRGLDARQTDADGFINNIADSYSLFFDGLFENKIYLYGHSAGGQFVSRYLAVHPNKINAALISAAGTYAFPSFDYTWTDGMSRLTDDFVWPGQDSSESRYFDFEPNPNNWLQIASLPVTVLVGELDTENNIPYSQGQSGTNAVNRGQAWVDAINEYAGITNIDEGVKFVLVEGVGHNSALLTPDSIDNLLGVQELICKEFTATNSEHESSGRVYSETTGWWWKTTTYFAVGSDENLGTSSSSVTTLKEDPQGYFKTGSCPFDPGPQAPVCELGYVERNQMGQYMVYGTMSDPDNDIAKLVVRRDGGEWTEIPMFNMELVVSVGHEDEFEPGIHTVEAYVVDSTDLEDNCGLIEFEISSIIVEGPSLDVDSLIAFMGIFPLFA